MAGIRFLHLADVHLGLRVTRFGEDVGRKLREARFQALDKAVQWAEQERVDCIVIAGDLFDDNAVSLGDAQRAYERLRGRPMPVYVLPGNHDPYCAGSVWQRPPWNSAAGTSVRVLAEPEPVAPAQGVTLLPCPVTGKRSDRDPTEWIRPNGGDRLVRIGIAHGTVMDRPQLPPDDHPLSLDAPAQRGFDYLALGHWHSYRAFIGVDGAVRMAYPGTSEQMSFDGAAFDSGWQAYAPGPQREEFRGGSPGSALSVQIEGPGAAPVVQPVPIGHYSWSMETTQISDGDFGRFFSDIAQRPDPGRHLLQLSLAGVLSIENWLRLKPFEEMLERYLHYELDTTGLQIRPDDEKLTEVAGTGVLGEVLHRLNARAEQEPEQRQVLDRAKLLLYQLAQEARP